jgi:hypothetical protein
MRCESERTKGKNRFHCYGGILWSIMTIVPAQSIKPTELDARSVFFFSETFFQLRSHLCVGSDG